MRSSTPPSKKITFASSPPSSMTTFVSGAAASTTLPVAYTSCTNGMPAASARPRPAEPDTVTRAARTPSVESISRSMSAAVCRTRDMCR